MRLTFRLSRLLMLAMAGFGLNGCSESSPEKMKDGDELYTYYCRSCHEQTGLGPFLEHLPLNTASLKQHEVVLMVKHGYPQGHRDMPVFPQLSSEQADAVASYILQQRYRRASQAN